MNRKKVYCFLLLKIRKRGNEKMKNIEEKILMADEGIKQLQNKRKNLSVSRNRKKEKREIKGYMKKEQFLKVSLQKVRILPKMNFIS